MTSGDLYQRAMDLFDAICDLPAADQTALLDEKCADDRDLRREVESLLAHDANECGAISDSHRGAGGDLLAAGLATTEIGVEPPKHIGRYRILREVGRGGMGTVYEAEQASPRRRVALKVIRSGLATRETCRRFEQEAQLLGHLQHPGIAHIYESSVGFVGKDRLPFFAMEFVDGMRLDQYVKSRQLTVRQRLALVSRVADAVQHAHQKGIVHRDLKPANILVVDDHTGTAAPADTTLEGKSHPSGAVAIAPGQPKILDFGIARATNADIHTVTIQTDIGNLVGTLAYMSPEQVTGDSSNIDTCCDVYALGVILYELLAWRLPHNLGGQPIPEAARIIREEDPERLGTIDARLRGDVDTIVSKALEKDKERRYATAAELAADIRRYLHDEPIEARPASASYQLRKFARRNRVLVGGMITTLMAFMIGGAFAVYFGVAAHSQRREAIAQRDTSDAVTDFLAEMLAAADPNVRGRDVTVREVLDKAAADIDGRFADQPLVAARLRYTIGTTYQGLGFYDLAETQLSAAINTRTELLGPDHHDTILTQIKLGEVYYFQGRLGDATEACETALAKSRRALDANDEVMPMALQNLAFMYMQANRHAEAESMFLQAIEGSSENGEESVVQLEIQSNLALLYTRMRRHDDAVPLYEYIIESSNRVRGPDHPETALVMANLASLYLDTKLYAEAVELLEHALDIQQRALGKAHSKTLITLNNLGNAHRRQKRFDLAEALYREGMETARLAYGDEHATTLMFRINLATFLADFRRYDEAGPMLATCYEQYRKTLGDEHPSTKFVRRKLDTLPDAIKRDSIAARQTEQ